MKRKLHPPFKGKSPYISLARKSLPTNGNEMSKTAKQTKQTNKQNN